MAGSMSDESTSTTPTGDQAPMSAFTGSATGTTDPTPVTETPTAKKTAPPAMVTVRFGPKTKTISPGKTVKDAADAVGAKAKWFGLQKPAVYVNGKTVTDWTQALRAGDDVEITKATGGKG
jgi:sulfur carrier protein ThiS